MSTPSGTPSVLLPDGGRRRLVRGGIVTACVLYVGILLLLPFQAAAINGWINVAGLVLGAALVIYEVKARRAYVVRA